MELRVLRYFVTVAEAGSITGAADILHVTQPTLSRQLAQLEDELGCQLLVRFRNNRRAEPTDAGRLLYERARQMLQLAEKTQKELADPFGSISGEIAIGGGETQGMRFIADAAARVHQEQPGVRFRFFSGNAAAVASQMKAGLIDIGVLVGETDLGAYDYLPLPAADTWGLVLRSDHPLCARADISREDLAGIPLIVSQQTLSENELAGWYGRSLESLQIVASYNLLYNATLLVQAGLGAALALDRLAGPQFSFRPLYPRLTAKLHVVWERGRIFSPAVSLFVDCLRQQIRLAQAQEGSPQN